MGQLTINLLLLIAVSSSFSLKHDESCTTQRYRHRFHFTPLENWSNDPNGLVYYDGTYHLFFQYHPYSTQWGDMHWGHAVSTDMLVWQQLPVALYPDQIGYIFSGSSVVDFQNTTGFQVALDAPPLVAIFTSASGENNAIQRQSIAYSLDKGVTFQKYENNPVLVNPAERDFRDPKVLFLYNVWVMVIAVQNRVEFYSSVDLKSWVLESEFGRNEGVHEGTWECPDLLEFEMENGEHLFALIVSVGSGGRNGGSGTHYFVGNFSRNEQNRLVFESFGWEDTQWLDWGPDNYAGVTFSNLPDSRKIYMAWMANLAYSGSIPTSSWRGQMTIPRQLTLQRFNASNYRLLSSPIQELHSLYDSSQHFELTQSFRVPPQTSINLTTSFFNPSMSLDIQLEMQNNPQFSICAYNSLSEEICFGWDGNQWFLDRSRSGNVEFHDMIGRKAYAKREVSNEMVQIQLLLDVSSLEVFVDNGLVTMTALHYPTEPFDQFYIAHWSTPSSPGVLTVKEIQINGILCWYPETGGFMQ